MPSLYWFLPMAFAVSQSTALPDLKIQDASTFVITADTINPKQTRSAGIPARILPLKIMTKGVLMLQVEQKEWIQLYDEQNKPWVSVHPDSALADCLQPYSGFLEYENLVFRVTEMDENFYQVIANEDKGLMAKISRQVKSLHYQTWPQHILRVFSVDFNASVNPVKTDTTSKARIIRDDSIEFFHPAGLNGDWLKVRWETDRGNKFGWIRWKRGNKLLVDLNYIP